MIDLKSLNVFEASLDGISLVEASAGTGKTYNITSLYVRAILEKGLEPSQILVMTFTEAATAELKARLRSRLKESLVAIRGNLTKDDEFLKELIEQNLPDAECRLKEAISSFDEASVFTIHGFCNRLLTEYSVQFDVPPNYELLADPSELLQECVDDYWRDFIQETDTDHFKWQILDYLTDIGFGPDDLQDVVKKVMDHKNAKVVPELDLSELKRRLDDLETVYNTIQSLWTKEKKSLQEQYNSEHLKKNIYTDATHERDWELLIDWLDNENSKVAVSDRLEKFGTKIYRSLKKSSPELPVLDICELIDEYLDKVESLKALKPAFIKRSVDDIRIRFENAKQLQQFLSYNDMLTEVEKGLQAQSASDLRNRLAQKYPIALVDEFQDTDQIQYNILKAIYHKRPGKGLFMIGDPKQAIYSFRGADVYTYLEAKDDVSKGQAYSLSNNYRSNREMIRGVNSLFEGGQNSFIVDDIQFQKAQFPDNKDDEDYLIDNQDEVVKPLQFITLDDQSYTNKDDINQAVFRSISKEILNLLSGEFRIYEDKEGFVSVQEKHIAILVRTGKEGEAIQNALREHDIKSVLRSNTSVFETDEAEQLFRILSAVQKISFEAGVRSALATNLLGFSAKDLLEMDQDETLWANQIEKFSKIKETWHNSGIDAAFNNLITLFDVFERLSLQRSAERQISNLLHISELLSKAARENRFTTRSLMRWYFQKINNAGESKASDDEELRLESDEELVQITTMHSSKGLQFPIVFCPFLWSSKAKQKSNEVLKFHNEGNIHIDVSQDFEHNQKKEFQNLTELQNKAEDVRLSYVALTRAKSACYVFLPDYNKINDSSISYILNGKDGNNATDFDSIRLLLEGRDHMLVRQPVNELKQKGGDWDKTEEVYAAAEFTRQDVFNFPRMLSYSTIVGGHSADDSARDYDRQFMIPDTDPDEKDKVKDQFTFPKGANAGSFLHTIFEDLSFSDLKNIDEVILYNLNRFGFKDEWFDTVKEWIIDSLNHTLGTPDASLSIISDDHVLKEMEFYFPVDELDTDKIWDIIRPDFNQGSTYESFYGFMKGFIDLTFQWNGKYYILDYKSNFLGNSSEDYGSVALANAMFDAGYDLQYHIYTLALHRYLNTRLRQYDYNEHFGGVLYFFLRGIKVEQAGSGIFFHKPEENVVRSLDDLFREGGS
ncbi:MAG: exodeoxyribonuclease V subunit beta [Gracilimonas sp.]|nr:exodeoxyribonuclease V subunit beta [Gracilimonas sp.]